LGVALKRRHAGAKLVYDAHELETERNGLGPLGRRGARLLERGLIGQVDQAFVVSRSIADWYRARYPALRLDVVRNRPAPRPLRPSAASRDAWRQRLGIRSGLVFLYQGALIPGRGIDLLLAVFSQAPRDRHMVFMGYGALEPEVRARARECPNIHFHPPVPPQDVVSSATGADVGVCLIENTCLSYYLSLPNKLYDYVAAGLPILVSDFPEMRAEVERLGNGWSVAVSREAVARLVAELSPEAIAQKAERSRDAQHVGWETEEPVLLEAYRRLLGRALPAAEAP
jgi:glycosyltransferase involved in cell wall biosynthesis